MVRQFFRALFKEPPTKRFDPATVTAYHGSHIGSSPVYHCDVTAHLANGQKIDLTAALKTI